MGPYRLEKVTPRGDVGTLNSTIEGLNRAGNALQQFDGLDAKINKTGDRIDIKNGRTSGQSIGLTAQGFVDLGNDTARLRGIVVPAFALNNLLSNVPLLGPLLTGGKDGGLFADLLPAARPARRSQDRRQHDVGRDAGRAARALHGAGRRRRRRCRAAGAKMPKVARKPQTARTRTWRLRPAESLSVPDESRSPSPTVAVSPAIGLSFSRPPPPLISLRASVRLSARPASCSSSKAAMPAASRARGTSTVGSASALAPSSKVRRAVSAACSAAAAPCARRVTSVARIFLASLISWPFSASSRAISASGSSVNSFRKRPTSASSVLRQYCQKS